MISVLDNDIVFWYCALSLYDIYYARMHLELSIRSDIQIEMANIYAHFLYCGKIWYYEYQ